MLKEPHSRPEVDQARAAHTAADDFSNRVAVLMLFCHMLTKLNSSCTRRSAVRALKRAWGCNGGCLALLVRPRGSRGAVQQGLVDPSAPSVRTLDGFG